MNTPKVNHRLGSEVLQPSSVSDFPWPLNPPDMTVQPVRQWSGCDSKLLDRAVSNTDFSVERFLQNSTAMTTAEKVWALLSHRAFNFNGAAVRTEVYWQSRVSFSVARGQPIVLAYPLVCKINNPAKRLTLVSMTAGERACVRFFRDLGRLVENVYAPGIRIHLLSDATLYNSALQVPPPAAYAYMEGFRQLLREEDAVPCVDVHDYASLLAPSASEFESLYNGYYAEIVGSPQAMLTTDLLGSLPTSVRASINTRRMGFDFDALRGLFGPDQTRFLPIRAEIDMQAIFALRDQLAIKMACDHLNLPERLWPNHIRATCHRGIKQGRNVLGLRCYPEYYASSHLLPYHGMPLIMLNKAGLPKMIIEPEISLRGRDDLTRILDERGDPVLYVVSAMLDQA